MNTFKTYFWIGIGSVFGGVARYFCGLAMAATVGTAFPWGTLLVNVIGCFVIGCFATLTGPDGRLLVSSLLRQFVMVGICGGYTTFSSFSLDTVALLRQGATAAAGANLLLSMLGCLAAVWLGHALAARINR